ncbi:uncharacterized protein BP01DRAFT_375838 [Aspergillus saccharolyticus JOP 1030-1]|uniref:Uncharacterized protein n=1 Tax=Aspergillus saccharolyticus JOP 1030-1 TaxID=1450539 RepID=A0A318Z7F2_9EURO|nr:hypothetical protein BP01DRAFT_375838 [Aspergillus saccharolyticus JOP 1030-1]PYH43039.1 hypothetical protein BP01DRAFT_375838 [Aspergillus saccharolyticus JOP 1030-1]
MQQDWLTTREVHVATERRLKYQDTARTWKEDGCRRLDVENYIPALASSEAISQALARIEMTPEWWWVVDIYLDDVDDALRDHLVEEYDLNREHADGYTYRKIRQFDDDHYIGTRWKAHLSSFNRQRWEQILLDIPGLWMDGMRLSMVYRLVAISCPENICAYLNRVHRFWSSLVNDDTNAKKCIDQKSIKKLELLASGTSPDDAKSAQQMILTGLIPSLRTFFEDFKYLESCAYCLKRLVDTINDYLIQFAEYEYRKVHMKQNHHLAKPKLAPADQHAIYNMAQLAHRLGFRSTEINTIINASPDHQIARTALLQAQKPDRYRYDADTFETLIDRLGNVLRPLDLLARLQHNLL